MKTCGLAIMNAWDRKTTGKIYMENYYCDDTTCENCSEYHRAGGGIANLTGDNPDLLAMLVTDPLERAIVEVHE